MVGQERIDMKRVLTALAWLGAALGLFGGLALLVSGLGTRWGWWNYRTGFQLLDWGACAGAAAVLVSLAALLGWRRGRGRMALWLPVAGVLLGALAVGIPRHWEQVAHAAPPIHDITTDTERPPEFVALAPARAASPNGAAYGGAAVAAQQHAAYPDIRPLRLDVPPDRALEAAAAVAREMGWAVAAIDARAGRLEATARTRWFGFSDDIVVRVTPEGSGSRLDVRSASRVGRGDVGTNARRVREFLDLVQRQAER